MKTAAGYIPGGSGKSPEKRSVIEQYCMEHDLVLEWLDSCVGIGEVVFGDWLNGRKVSVVVTADSADVSERFYEYQAYRCVLKRRHSDLVSVNDRFGKKYSLHRSTISAFVDELCRVELEHEPLRKTNGRIDKAARGKYIGGNPPMGYKVVNGQLEVNPEEVPVVLFVMDRKRTGKTMLSTVDALNQNGYKTRRGKPFVISTVQSIWNNEMVYRGYYRYSGDGKDGEWVKGQHEAILKD